MNVLDNRIYWEQQKQRRLDKQLKEANKNNEELRVLLNCVMRLNNHWNIIDLTLIIYNSHALESIEFGLFLLLHFLLPLALDSFILGLLSVPLALSDFPCRWDDRTLFERIDPLFLFRDPLLYDWHLLFILLWLSCSFFRKNSLNYHGRFINWL